MNILKIGDMSAQTFNPQEVKKSEINKKDLPDSVDKVQNDKKRSNWQKDILVSALDKLENSIQLDENHPLDKSKSQPIESYQEALIELSFIKSPFFKEQAAEAQANIEPESILSLFADEPDLVK